MLEELRQFTAKDLSLPPRITAFPTSIFTVFGLKCFVPWKDVSSDEIRNQPNITDYILTIKPTRCTNFSNLFLE